MSIDTIENVLMLLAVIGGSLYSLLSYVRAPKREWLYLSVFFLTHMLSDYYWTTYTLVMGENPNVSAGMAYLGWNIGYVFLLFIAIRMRRRESVSYKHFLMFVPIPLGIIQFFIYIQYGGVFNNIWEGVLATSVSCLCLQSICHYVKNKGDNTSFPWFHAILFLHIFFEYGMWTASCFNWPSDALNPYYYFVFGDIPIMLLLVFFAKKELESKAAIPEKTAQETRFDVYTQIAISAIIILGTMGGYVAGYKMKNALEMGIIDERRIAVTLFLISLTLIAFTLIVIAMTAMRYRAMAKDKQDEAGIKRGRFNFIFTIVVTFSLMVVSVVYTSQLFYRVSVNGVVEDGQARVRSSADELENYLSVARSVLWVTADTVEMMRKDKQPQEKVVDYIYKQTKNQKEQFDENFTGIYAYIDGEYIDGSGWVPPADYNVEERDWYKAAVDAKGKTIIVSPYVDADTGSLVITICKLLDDGKDVGDYKKREVVALDMVVNHVQEVTEEVNIRGKGYAMVVNHDGLIVSHSNSDVNGKNIGDVYDRELLFDIVRNDNGSVRTSVNGEECTLFVKSVLEQWYVVIVVSDSELYEETNSQLWVNIIVSLIIFLFITFFYYLGYKNEQLNAGKMEEMRANALRKEYEAQVLLQKKNAADVANKAKSSFLAQMSHEIRTPINAVLGMNEMILRKSKDDEILEYSENIDSAGKTLLALINSILDFSKIEDGKMDIIPANYNTVSLIKNPVNAILQRAESKGLTLLVDVDDSLPKVLFGDDVRVTQVIMNLLTNAVKYTEKGSITYTIKCEERYDDKIKLYVSVKDTGIGIKPEDLDRLSVSFERLEEKRNRNIEGTGLGMAIVTNLLKMMGSKICVESTYGQGSLFYFVLEQTVVDDTPVGSLNDFKEDSAAKRSGDDLISAPSARILVCDDNELNLKVAKHLLKLCEINPDMVSSGEEVIKKMEQNTYDIVFIDHMMPVMDGIDTLHELQARSLIPENTKVIVLTANAVVGAREEYLKEGFDDYLSKPIEIPNLVEMLTKYLPQQ